MTTNLSTRSPESIDLDAIEASLKDMEPGKLKLRFFECYTGAARLMAEAAVCVKLLKAADQPLTGIPMVGTFLRIASGQIDPQLVWEFIESPNRSLVERLPLDEQERLAADPMVPVVEPRNDKNYSAGFTQRLVDLRTAPREVARLAIGPAGIRNAEDQIRELTTPKRRPAPPEPTPEVEPVNQRLLVKLTAAEYQALRHHAADDGVTESEMARQFLRQAGAFKRLKP